MAKRACVFLLGAACVLLSGESVFAAAIAFELGVNGSAIDPAAINCAMDGDLARCTGANISGAGYELNSLNFLLDPDPSLTGSFTLTNLSNVTQTFMLTVSLSGLSPIAAPLSISGSIGAGTLTDVNGGGATLTDAGSAIYTGLLDGSGVRTLLDPPQFFNVPTTPSGGPGAPVTISQVTFGPEALAQSLAGSIGIQVRFTLTSGDQVALPMSFDVQAAPVPEPATFLMLGAGLAALLCRRQRAA